MTLQDSLMKLIEVPDHSVYVVTARSGDERGGCLVAFTTQASIDPVRFLVLLSHGAHTYGLVEDSSACALHWLDRDQETLARHFGESTGFEADKFESVSWSPGKTGSPILADAPAYVEMEIDRQIVCGDHTAYLGEPVEAEARNDFRPLTVKDIHRLGIRWGI